MRQSPHSNEFNYEVMTDDLSEFLNEHQIKAPVIIGHSMGGRLLMKFALRNEDLLNKLIVVDIRPTSFDFTL